VAAFIDLHIAFMMICPFQFHLEAIWGFDVILWAKKEKCLICRNFTLSVCKCFVLKDLKMPRGTCPQQNSDKNSVGLLDVWAKNP